MSTLDQQKLVSEALELDSLGQWEVINVTAHLLIVLFIRKRTGNTMIPSNYSFLYSPLSPHSKSVPSPSHNPIKLLVIFKFYEIAVSGWRLFI